MKYSKQTTEELCKYISNGLSQKDAAVMAGTTEKSFYEWMKKSEFSESVKKATVGFKLYHLHNIAKHAATTFTASAWLLERKFPEEFSINAQERQVLEDIKKRVAELEQAGLLPKQQHGKAIEEKLGEVK